MGRLGIGLVQKNSCIDLFTKILYRFLYMLTPSPTNVDFPIFLDQTFTHEGIQLFFKNDDTIGESLRRYGEWARNELNFFSQFISPGDVVLDIGCNVGTHTMFFSDKVEQHGRVLAFDAHLAAIACTSMTALLQNRSNIDCLNVAIGENVAKVNFPTPDYTMRNNFGAMQKKSSGKEVQQISIDTLNLDHVNFIKMDIEGSELSALRGAVKTIATNRPIVSCEINSEDAKQRITNFFSDFGYICEDISIPAFNAQNLHQDLHNIFGPTNERLLLCSPK